MPVPPSALAPAPFMEADTVMRPSLSPAQAPRPAPDPRLLLRQRARRDHKERDQKERDQTSQGQQNGLDLKFG